MKNKTHQLTLSSIETALNDVNLAIEKLTKSSAEAAKHMEKAQKALIAVKNQLEKTHLKLPRAARTAVVFLAVFLNLFFISPSSGQRESTTVDGFGKTRHEAIQDGQVRSRQIGQIYILREVRQVGDSTYRATFTVRGLRGER
jgi:uncharacterized protein (UPF0210 family)